jgi:hypothetical protein
MLARSALLAAAAAVALGTLAAAPAPSHAAGEAAFCSRAWRPADRSPTDPHFLGVATADTVDAGPRADSTAPPRTWVQEGRVVRGQVVEVRRAGGAGADALERVLAARGSRRVVVVAWGFGAGCEPMSWQGPAAFAPVGETGMFSADLRPRAEWVGGMPTFDAWDAEAQPYPGAPLLKRVGEGRPGAMLTAEEFFGFYAALPVRARGARPAMTPELARWRAAHPELATRFPADAVLRMLDPASAPPR